MSTEAILYFDTSTFEGRYEHRVALDGHDYWQAIHEIRELFYRCPADKKAMLEQISNIVFNLRSPE